MLFLIVHAKLLKPLDPFTLQPFIVSRIYLKRRRGCEKTVAFSPQEWVANCLLQVLLLKRCYPFSKPQLLVIQGVTVAL